MKIEVDIIDSEYYPVCPQCKKVVEIDEKDIDENCIKMCPTCFLYFQFIPVVTKCTAQPLKSIEIKPNEICVYFK